MLWIIGRGHRTVYHGISGECSNAGVSDIGRWILVPDEPRLERYAPQPSACRLLTARCGSMGLPVRLQRGTVFTRILVNVGAAQGASTCLQSQFHSTMACSRTRRLRMGGVASWTSKSRRLSWGVVRADCFATLNVPKTAGMVS